MQQKWKYTNLWGSFILKITTFNTSVLCIQIYNAHSTTVKFLVHTYNHGNYNLIVPTLSGEPENAFSAAFYGHKTGQQTTKFLFS